MRKNNLFFTTVSILALLFCGFTKKTTIKQINSFEPITVLELFTSQGCSSCPSADKLLSQTIADAAKTDKKIYALSFHVDYWNRLGWADPFSSKQFSERQANYVDAFNLNGAYTPQMVVNGTQQFTGSDKIALQKNIAITQNTDATAHFKTLTTTITNNTLKINYALEGLYTNCNINFAIVTSKETTIIKRGENEGLTLTNENVVKKFITKNALQETYVEVDNVNLFAKNNTVLVAYVQQQKDNKIIGAALQKL
jgi:hypothetical protein